MFKIKLRKYIMTIDGWTYKNWNFIKAKNDLLLHLTLRHVKPLIITSAVKALKYVQDMYNGVPESKLQKPKGVDIKMGLDEPDIYYSVSIKKDDDGSVFFTVKAKEISHV